MLRNMIKKITCDKGNHKWDYYRSIRYIRELDTLSIVPNRECGRCGNLEWKIHSEWEKSD